MVIRRLQQILPWRNPLHTEDDHHITPKSIFIRHVDAGSSNAIEQEITALFNPVYDVERFGFHLVASPRHADILLITGPFTRSMEAAALAAFHAMPEPRRVITAGDGFEEDSVFHSSYAVTPLPDEIAAVRVAHIPGDPPSPQQILDVLLSLETFPQ
jgi:Ni,Fe-hydrogenase III small subunit